MNCLQVKPLGKLEVQSITHEGREFVLSQLIKCDVTSIDDDYFVQFDPLPGWGMGTSREEAIKDFAGDFAFAWDEYAEAEDSELTLDARELKQFMRQIVREVQSV